jgi:hypothetical protein
VAAQAHGARTAHHFRTMLQIFEHARLLPDKPATWRELIFD